MSSLAAIYARISRDAEGEAVGVANQEAAARKIAERDGLTVVAVYLDNDVSASTNSRKARPEFEAMVAAAERGEFGTIIAYSMSRLTRRPAEWERLIDLGQRHGVTFRYSVSPTYDLNTADGRATARTVAAWDAAEAERTSERRKLRNSAAVAQGIPAGRPRVFGYEPDGMTPRESEAAMIRAGIESIIDGTPVREIARAWNAAGSRTTRGKEWSAVTTRNTLLRERNAGILVANGEVQPVSKITPIVAREDWETARAILTAAPNARRGRTTARRWLSGVATCWCGDPMVIGASWSRGAYSPAYTCRKIAIAARTPGQKTPPGHARIKAERAEAVLPDAIMRELGKRRDAPEQASPERRALIAQRAALAEQISRAKGLYAEFGGTDDLALVRKLQGEHDVLTDRIDSLAADTGHAAVIAAAVAAVSADETAWQSLAWDISDEASDEIFRAASRVSGAFHRHWEALDTAGKQALTRAVFASIVINPPKSSKPRIQVAPRGPMPTEGGSAA